MTVAFSVERSPEYIISRCTSRSEVIQVATRDVGIPKCAIAYKVNGFRSRINSHDHFERVTSSNHILVN